MNDGAPRAGKIITASFGGAGETKVTQGTYCRHARYEVDGSSRSVHCAVCGATLDAFKVLLEYADGERHFTDWRKQAREESRRVNELQEEEKRIKARMKSHSRKDAKAAVAAARSVWERDHERAIYAIEGAGRLLEKAVRAMSNSKRDEARKLPMRRIEHEDEDGNRWTEFVRHQKNATAKVDDDAK